MEYYTSEVRSYTDADIFTALLAQLPNHTLSLFFLPPPLLSFRTESHGINIKELSVLSCKWYAYTSVLSILQAGAGMVGLYARVQAGKPHPSSKSQLPIIELANVNYAAMPLLVSSLFLLAFNNSRTPGLTNMCLWKPEKVNLWVYHHRDWIHLLALIAAIVPMYIFSNVHKTVVLFLLASVRKLRGGVTQTPTQPIP